jgi:hypothetical protein
MLPASDALPAHASLFGYVSLLLCALLNVFSHRSRGVLFTLLGGHLCLWHLRASLSHQDFSGLHASSTAYGSNA